MIATQEWSNYANKDGSGYYFSLLERAFPGYQYSVTFMPYARSLAMLEQQQVDLVFGASEDDFDDARCGVSLVEVDRSDMLTSQRLASGFRSSLDLNGKYVVSRIGYDWRDQLPAGTRYKEYASLAQMIKLLSVGRVDAVLEYRDEIEQALLKLGGDYQQLVIVDNVVEYGSTFCFAANKRGEYLQKQFDRVMLQMIESGELRALMLETLGSDEDYPY
jgi:ABC-type amino acid transport substrate-binding protein